MDFKLLTSYRIFIFLIKIHAEIHRDSLGIQRVDSNFNTLFQIKIIISIKSSDGNSQAAH
jgi:hypothetical protein